MKQVLLYLPCLILLSGDHPAIQDTIVRSGGVDFTYHSHVEQLPNGAFNIINFLRNNNKEDGLNIDWAAAHLTFIGADVLTYIAQPSTLGKVTLRNVTDLMRLPHTSITFGPIHPRTVEVDCYIDNSPNKDQAEIGTKESIEQLDENGRRIFDLDISSRMYADLNTSILTIRASGGVNLLFRDSAAASFLPMESSTSWTIKKYNSLADSNLNTGAVTRRIVAALGGNLGKKGDYQAAYYFYCMNRTDEDQELKLVINNSKRRSKPVRFVAYSDAKQYGAIGFSAEIFE